jgi:pyrophosphatase PpaX
LRIKAVIFDLDGTLGDTLPVVIQAFQETFLRYNGQAYTAEDIHAMFGPNEEGVILRRVSEADYPAALAAYTRRYTELHQQASEPFAGVIALLARLQTLGIHRAIVTGKGPGTAQASLDVMGLAPYIEALKPGSAASAEKPAAIRELLALWNLHPQEAAYVGDMPYDMEAAREAGVIPLGAAWAATTTVKEGDGADEIFSTVEELLAWIESRL